MVVHSQGVDSTLTVDGHPICRSNRSPGWCETMRCIGARNSASPLWTSRLNARKNPPGLCTLRSSGQVSALRAAL